MQVVFDIKKGRDWICINRRYLAAQEVVTYSVNSVSNIKWYEANDQGSFQDNDKSSTQGKDRDEKKCCPIEKK